MAVYGNGNGWRRRKRFKSSSEVSVFSSDEDGEALSSESTTTTSVIDHSIPVSSAKLVQAVTRTANDVGRTQLSINDLLPSIQLEKGSEEPVKNRIRPPFGHGNSTYGNVDDDDDDDELTRSPKKFTNVITVIQSSPTRKSSSPLRTPPRVRKSSLMAKFLAVANPPPRPPATKVVANSPNKVTPKATAEEKDAWDDLFDTIGQNVEVPPSVQQIASESDLDDIHEEVDEDDEEAEHEAIGVPRGGDVSNIDLQSIYDSFDTTTNEEAKPSPGYTKILQENSRMKTYSSERSFLYDVKSDEESTKVEHQKLISNHHDYEHDVMENDKLVSINDLRNLGKLNDVNDNLNYIVEGLQLVYGEHSNVRIESINSVLISSLIDLHTELSENRHSLRQVINSHGAILRKLKAIMNQLRNASDVDGGGRDLISWLVCLNLLQCINFGDDLIIEQFSGLLPTILRSYLSGTMEDYDGLQVSSFNKNRINTLKSSPQLYNELGKVLVKCQQFQTWEVFLIMEDQLTRGHVKRAILLDYFEAYFESNGEIHKLTNFSGKLLENCFKRIHDQVEEVGDEDVQFIKILVILTTNYSYEEYEYELRDIFRLEYLSLALDSIPSLINRNQINLSLFLWGYLINFVESITIKTIPEAIIQNIAWLNQQPPPLQQEEKEEKVHLMGYNSIFVSCVVLQHRQKNLAISPSELMVQLRHFKSSISNRGVIDKIDHLLVELSGLVP